ncbi:hypothetical protein [Sphingomonas sp.]|uniref:hypothetical protein n=1 Tax=Sphingomonas sp. TaxID=28214 RepID=UPI0035B191D8
MNRPPISFAGDRPLPRRRGDWAGIGRMAAQLLDQREKGYPAAIEAKKLTPDDAERGLRIMRAIVALWRMALEPRDLPQPADYRDAFGATWEEMRDDAMRVAGGAWQRARRDPEDADLAAQAELAEALAWQHRDVCGSAGPHVWLAHDYEQWERRRSAS